MRWARYWFINRFSVVRIGGLEFDKLWKGGGEFCWIKNQHVRSLGF